SCASALTPFGPIHFAMRSASSQAPKTSSGEASKTCFISSLTSLAAPMGFPPCLEFGVQLAKALRPEAPVKLEPFRRLPKPVFLQPAPVALAVALAGHQPGFFQHAKMA